MKVVYTVTVVFFIAVLCGHADCAEKVQLGFYSESLCPDCIYYANGPLDKAMEEVFAGYYHKFCISIFLFFPKVGDIFTLNYVPWGNAELKKDGSIECQHGKLECTLNTVEACALHYYPTELVGTTILVYITHLCIYLIAENSFGHFFIVLMKLVILPLN